MNREISAAMILHKALLAKIKLVLYSDIPQVGGTFFYKKITSFVDYGNINIFMRGRIVALFLILLFVKHLGNILEVFLIQALQESTTTHNYNQ